MSAFDTLTYAKKLQQAGFTPQQAEAQVDALRALVEDNLATKHDLKELEMALRHEIELVRRDVVIKLGGLIVAGVSVLAALIGVVIALMPR